MFGDNRQQMNNAIILLGARIRSIHSRLVILLSEELDALPREALQGRSEDDLQVATAVMIIKTTIITIITINIKTTIINTNTITW